MGKVIAVVSGLGEQVVFDADEGGLNIEVKRRDGDSLFVSLDEHDAGKPVNLHVDYWGGLKAEHVDPQILEGEQQRIIFSYARDVVLRHERE